MDRTAKIISIYAADISGVCSALYEYGGMTVIHDASGCNSTYTTHDEPRWYDMDSMVFISALTERDAVMGNDEKLINDLCITAEQLSPRFIALCASPMPAMTGVDLDAIAYEAGERTGIPSFAVSTNGMSSYIKGAENAFYELARIFAKDAPVKEHTVPLVNILGMTPLDHPLDLPQKLRKLLQAHGLGVNAVMGMGSSPDDVIRLPQADVSLVVSSCGKKTAEWLFEKYGIPYVTGLPIGEKLSEHITTDLKRAASEKINISSCREHRICGEKCAVIGESVLSASYACMLSLENGMPARVLESVGEGDMSVLCENDLTCCDEDILQREIKNSDIIYADPLYRPICGDKTFVPVPHRAFSGRCFTGDL